MLTEPLPNSSLLIHESANEVARCLPGCVDPEAFPRSALQLPDIVCLRCRGFEWIPLLPVSHKHS